MHTTKLTLEERRKIQDLLGKGYNFTCIGRKIGRSKTGVTHEINKNGGPSYYNAEKADKDAKVRIQAGWDKQKKAITQEKLEFIKKAIENGESVASIARHAQCGQRLILKLIPRDYKKEKMLNYIALRDRVEALESQNEIIIEQLKMLVKEMRHEV